MSGTDLAACPVEMVMTGSTSDDLIYLDHNATTPLAPEVLDAMLPYLTQHYGNPSSDHPLGHRAHQAVEDAREQVASLIGAEVGEIIFTSGGTESNNIAIRGTRSNTRPQRAPVISSRHRDGPSRGCPSPPPGRSTPRH
jgi:cysteine desulfurase